MSTGPLDDTSPVVWGTAKLVSEDGQTRASERREEKPYLSPAAAHDRIHRPQTAAAVRAHDAPADSQDEHWVSWSGDGPWHVRVGRRAVVCGAWAWILDREREEARSGTRAIPRQGSGTRVEDPEPRIQLLGGLSVESGTYHPPSHIPHLPSALVPAQASPDLQLVSP